MDIDVSKCDYYRLNNKMPMCRACINGVGSPYCEYNKNCYYKQLQQYKDLCARKTADIFDLENEKQELKQKLEKIKEIMNTTVFSHQMYDEIREIMESEE